MRAELSIAGGEVGQVAIDGRFGGGGPARGEGTASARIFAHMMHEIVDDGVLGCVPPTCHDRTARQNRSLLLLVRLLLLKIRFIHLYLWNTNI